MQTRASELAELRRQALEGSKIDVLQAKVQKNEIDLAYQQRRSPLDGFWKSLTAKLAGTTLRCHRCASTVSCLSPMRHSIGILSGLRLSAESRIASDPQTRVRQARLPRRQGVQAI
ncbi:MAG: hypothetical protein R3C56_25000 [Pirellulaceae bacterium]